MQSLHSVMSWEYLQEERHQQREAEKERHQLLVEQWADRLRTEPELLAELIADPPTTGRTPSDEARAQAWRDLQNEDSDDGRAIGWCIIADSEPTDPAATIEGLTRALTRDLSPAVAAACQAALDLVAR